MTKSIRFGLPISNPFSVNSVLAKNENKNAIQLTHQGIHIDGQLKF
jgi:hypothetical protein